MERTFGYTPRHELRGYLDREYTQEWVCPTLEFDDCYWETITTPGDSISYAYDAVGNRTDSGAILYATSNRYQLLGGYNFEYDADGNLKRKYRTGFDQLFTWNSLGQLTSVTTNGTTVTYRYNGFGERIYRAVASSGSRYIYDGNDLALEIDLAGNKVREYTYYPGIDAPHSMFTSAGAVYYYATENPGHVNGLLSASGTLTNSYRYSPWGVAQQVTEGVTNPLQFMSRELDSQTGLYYVRNRWYDPQMARFISEDPLGLADGVNSYAYAGNNPILYKDPTGLCKDGKDHAFIDTEAETPWGTLPPLVIEACIRVSYGSLPGWIRWFFDSGSADAMGKLYWQEHEKNGAALIGHIPEGGEVETRAFRATASDNGYLRVGIDKRTGNAQVGFVGGLFLSSTSSRFGLLGLNITKAAIDLRTGDFLAEGRIGVKGLSVGVPASISGNLISGDAAGCTSFFKRCRAFAF